MTMAMAMVARAMAMVTRVRGEQQRGRWQAPMTVVVMRVASDKEGEGGKVMEMVTRLAGEQRQWQQRGQWRW
jgi:hypothetical protein